MFGQKKSWRKLDELLPMSKNLHMSCISARPGLVLEGDLISGAKDSIILEKEGRFQGSLQFH